MAYNARLFKGNIKVGHMYTWNKLAGNTLFEGIKGTCGKHCTGCWNTEEWRKSNCYVAKSYRYSSVRKGHARNTIAMRQNAYEAFKEIDMQLKRSKNDWPVRIHSSGEFESAAEIMGWFNIALANPTRTFYVYTKAYEELDQALSSMAVPKNFYINVSIWHEQGIKLYQKYYATIPNLRAFVYDDGYDYTAHGIQIKNHCPAYDAKGKLNHAITCDKCKWCFKDTRKIVACYDH